MSSSERQAAKLRDALGEAVALHQNGRLDEARARYQALAAASPRAFDPLYLLGVLHLQAGDAAAAEASLARATRLRADVPVAHAALGKALILLGRHEEAVAACDRALRLNPAVAETHYNRGLALNHLARLEAAIGAFDAAIALKPGLMEAHYGRGAALNTLERYDEALVSLQVAVRLRPDLPEPHHNLGLALQGLGRVDEALTSYDQALAIDPLMGEAHNARGFALNTLGRPAEALPSLDRALELQPDYAAAHNNRGASLHTLGRLDEARAAFDRCLALEPGADKAAYNLGLLDLTSGDLLRGWAGYELRLRKPGHPVLSYDPARRWRGEADLAGRTLLVHYEQGLGDTLQFARYLDLVLPLAGHVAFKVQPSLQSLLQRAWPEVEIYAAGAPDPAFDLHCPLLSLPLAFGTTLETIPASRRLTASAEATQRMAALLGPRTQPRVGLAWSGNPKHPNDAARSMPFEMLEPLLSADMQWTALQTEIRPTETEAFARCGRVGFHGPALNDFEDTAALVEAMDLVITVDTSVAHLAGAMGKPVWVLIAYSPDWRWLLQRADSPWHPSARLFRQGRFGDWAGVCDEVAAALKAAQFF